MYFSYFFKISNVLFSEAAKKRQRINKINKNLLNNIWKNIKLKYTTISVEF